MASRPFATINVALETDEEPPDLIGGNVKVSSTFFFSLSLSDQHQTPEISPLPGLTGRQTGGGEATIHHQGRRSSLPQVGLQSFYPSTAVCDYSHAAVIDIPHTICLTSFLSMNYIR